MRNGEFEREIKRRLKGAKKIVVMAVGDELDPRDCLGILAGKRISSLRLRQVKVLLTSQMPENYTSVVRRERPSHIVLIDAAEMGGAPGDVRLIHPGSVVATRVSTHAMPLSLLMGYLEKELKASVLLIGIQPSTTRRFWAHDQPPGIVKGIERIARGLKEALWR